MNCEGGFSDVFGPLTPNRVQKPKASLFCYSLFAHLKISSVVLEILRGISWLLLATLEVARLTNSMYL